MGRPVIQSQPTSAVQEVRDKIDAIADEALKQKIETEDTEDRRTVRLTEQEVKDYLGDQSSVEVAESKLQRLSRLFKECSSYAGSQLFSGKAVHFIVSQKPEYFTDVWNHLSARDIDNIQWIQIQAEGGKPHTAPPI